MTNSIKIHPSMKFRNRPTKLNIYEANTGVRFHFVYTGNNHIPGFYLFTISSKNGLVLDQGICGSMNGVLLDLDHRNKEALKIIGIDLI